MKREVSAERGALPPGKTRAENLKRAHATLESGKARGKLVLEGF